MNITVGIGRAAHIGSGGPGLGMPDRLGAVEQDAIRLDTIDGSAHGRVGQVIKHADVVPLVTEDRGHDIPNSRIVIDDEDADRPRLPSFFHGVGGPSGCVRAAEACQSDGDGGGTLEGAALSPASPATPELRGESMVDRTRARSAVGWTQARPDRNAPVHGPNGVVAWGAKGRLASVPSACISIELPDCCSTTDHIAGS